MRLALSPLLAALALFAGCAPSAITDDGVSAGDVDTTQDLVFHLGRQGFVLRPVSVTVPYALDVPGQVYEVDGGGLVAVYEFLDEDRAERGADAFQLDTFGATRPSVFQRGPLVVASLGGQSALHLTLTRALGAAVY